MAVVWRGDSPVLFWITALAVVSSLFIGFANAIPFRRLPAWWPGALRSDEEGPSDGFLALHAMRAHRNREDNAWTENPDADSGPPREVVTEPVRRVIATAADEAEGLGNPYVGTEHLLLGLLSEREANACRVLQRSGLTTERVRAELPQPSGERAAAPAQSLPLTPAARRTFDRAGKALSLRDDECVDTQHVLLGLIQEQDGLAMQVLDRLSVDPSQLRKEAMLAVGEGTKVEAVRHLTSARGASG